ncbi:MAG: N-acetylmuramoyl-L-alanine amidase [Bacteroidales bacterium]|nr:MAG: N-acetylmuramoyl-L-alanine amidase [Bacteroidales bacterium]
MIDQQIWREGLPEPDYERIIHNVRNIIIHHSATSNDLTDYTNVVRNIYLSHTQVNGWSDIGYNYVIAQDGTIYKGRDPGIYEQDNVMGAHFCSSNSGTMGICLLGNYVNIYPAQESLYALINLLTWKTGKDSLNPYGTSSHPLNPDLNIIAGHRDGCSTLCPGDSIYEMLGFTRQETSGKLKSCGYNYFSSIASEGSLPEIQIYQCQADKTVKININDLYVTKICLADLQGRIILSCNIHKLNNNQYYFYTDTLSPGIYFVVIISDKSLFSEKIIVH